MGRGGGGGSSHSSSHHSSSHSHSSSGSRRSRSYSSGSSSSSRHSRSSSYNHRSGSRYSGTGGYTGGRRSSGCGTLLFVFFLFIAMSAVAFRSYYLRDDIDIRDITFEGFINGDYLPVERSTVQREKLPESKCKEVDFWYQDDWGTWIEDSDEEFSLLVGLKSFYRETGVQPYLWIMGEEGKDYMSEGSMEELGNAKYKELFGSDEGHLLVIFREYPDNSSNYICTVTAGNDAYTQVMDDQAREILLDYIDYHYTDDCSEGEFFERAFLNAGTRIMTKQMSWRQICTIVIVAIIVVIGLVITISIVSSIIKKRKIAVAKQKTLQAQEKAKEAQAVAQQKQTDFDRKQYEDHLETQYVAVNCPNCGASNIKIRKTTVGYCDYCGTAMRADENGMVVIVTGNEGPSA